MGAADTVKVVETTAGGEVIGEAGEAGAKAEEEAVAVVPEVVRTGVTAQILCHHCFIASRAYIRWVVDSKILDGTRSPMKERDIGFMPIRY